MSRNSKSINNIKLNLDGISGCDGGIGYITENLSFIIESINKGKKINYKNLKNFKKSCQSYNSNIKNR